MSEGSTPSSTDVPTPDGSEFWKQADIIIFMPLITQCFILIDKPLYMTVNKYLYIILKPVELQSSHQNPSVAHQILRDPLGKRCKLFKLGISNYLSS